MDLKARPLAPTAAASARRPHAGSSGRCWPWCRTSGQSWPVTTRAGTAPQPPGRRRAQGPGAWCQRLALASACRPWSGGCRTASPARRQWLRHGRRPQGDQGQLLVAAGQSVAVGAAPAPAVGTAAIRLASPWPAPVTASLPDRGVTRALKRSTKTLMVVIFN